MGLWFENLRSMAARMASLDIGYTFSGPEGGRSIILTTGDWLAFSPWRHFTDGY